MQNFLQNSCLVIFFFKIIFPISFPGELLMKTKCCQSSTGGAWMWIKPNRTKIWNLFIFLLHADRLYYGWYRMLKIWWFKKLAKKIAKKTNLRQLIHDWLRIPNKGTMILIWSLELNFSVDWSILNHVKLFLFYSQKS